MTLTFFRVKLGSKHSNDLQAGCRARQWAYKKFVGLGLTPSTYKFFVVPCLALQPLLECLARAFATLVPGYQQELFRRKQSF